MFHLMIHQCDYEKLQRELIWRMTLLIGEGRAAVCMGFFFEDVDQRRECIRIVRLRDGMEP